MKEAKQILIVCLIITFVSFIGIMVLHYEIDIWMINRITEKEWK